MTNQTPLERLEEAIEEWGEAYTDLHSYGGELWYAAITYRHYAEARIKELEVEMEKLIPLVALQAEQISRMSSQEKLNDN